MTKRWFASKRYGWGWTPVTWQGWFVTLGYIALMVSTSFALDLLASSNNDALLMIAPFWVLLTFLLILVCYRTGEKPRWRWGD